MSKDYDLYCLKHGHIEIRVEKPPIMPLQAPTCPFCLLNPIKPDKDAEKKWQPGYSAEGVRA